LAQVKIDWKTTNITSRKTSVPQSLCVSTRSRRSVQVTGRCGGRVTRPAVAARIAGRRDF
jgi:hypothetical protein